MVEPVEQHPRAGQDRARGGVQVFPQRDIDGVEQSGISGRGDPGIGGLDQQPGAVEMQPEPMLAGEAGDPPEFGETESGAVHPAHRRFDRNRADRDRDACVGRRGRLGCDLFQRKGGAAGGQRHQVETAQLLRAVALVAIEVTFTLNQYAAAGAGQ